ncbi:MAG: chemotaxis protein [Desertifilum sp. SIO1I2]|nr:chemotaxis protein [Desertifilum sp. SIO1I2]
MSIETIEALLQTKMGLDANLGGRSAIALRIQERMRQCNLTEIEDYSRLVAASVEELDTLVESVVVPETWFFRDRESYNRLTQFIKQEWLPQHRNRTLRILSVPCSTGEEPYSIAIALLEAGLTPQQFTIDAVDISKQALNQAQRGIYVPYSFRTPIPTLQSQYFQLTPEGYQLQPSIKNLVNFHQGNLVEPQFFYRHPPYHVIFCRNLLIYLVQSARVQAVQNLDRLLAPNGLLFVGSSEMRQINVSDYTPVNHPLAFAFRKLTPPSAASPSPTQRYPVSKKTLLPPTPPRDVPPPPPPPKPSSSPSPPETQLETAQKLADDGQLNRATQLCETYLSRHPTSAEAYTLLGQIYQAVGEDTKAEQSFVKAVYLNPNQSEALLHLALLKENAGDLKGAQLLRQRLQRLPRFSQES